MAVFYPPPQPFIGGRQPLAPAELPPSITAVPVNNPPFTHPQRTAQYLELIRLSDAPPPNAFIGGRQPLAPATLAPSITAVTVNNPPFGKLFPQVLVANLWTPGPPLPTLHVLKTPPSIVVAAYIPPIPNLQAVLQWWVKVVLPEIPAPSQISSVDNPPALAARRPADEWWGKGPLPELPSPAQIISVDNPPPRVSQVVSAIPVISPYQQPVYVVQPFVQTVVDQPPTWAQSLVQFQWWQVPPPSPLQLAWGEAIYEPPPVITVLPEIFIRGGDDAPRKRKRKRPSETLDQFLDRVIEESVPNAPLPPHKVEALSKAIITKERYSEQSKLDQEIDDDDEEILMWLL